MNFYTDTWNDYHTTPTTNPLLRSISLGLLLDEPNNKLTARIYVPAKTQQPGPPNSTSNASILSPATSNKVAISTYTYTDLSVWQQISIDQIFDLDVLRKRRGWSDYQMWAVANSQQGFFSLIQGGPFPVYTDSVATHFEVATTLRSHSFLALMSLNVPFASSTLADCFLWLKIGPEGRLLYLSPETEASLTRVPMPVVNGEPAYLSYLCQQNFFGFKLTTDYNLTATTPGTVKLQVIDAAGSPITTDLDVYIDHVNGSVSHNRITTKNGIGSFKVFAFGMEKGETVKIKVGAKYFRSIASITLSVY